MFTQPTIYSSTHQTLMLTNDIFVAKYSDHLSHLNSWKHFTLLLLFLLPPCLLGGSSSSAWPLNAGSRSVFSLGPLTFSVPTMSLRDIIHSSDSSNRPCPADPAQSFLQNFKSLFTIDTEYTGLAVPPILRFKLSKSEIMTIPPPNCISCVFYVSK